ncbi:DUF74-domain-containing protein [Auricularia subglabra TFB-10046 SS5]|uniref:DUF74-domain-containing protein n=1 Tax=Auricularia subglabra (strain TFB-10046 / SS5) TaxID=717982 RepID=J0LFQ4_AURST|nr:DUF74-domain-containing protein [Auricularia subglabra TFB-10046 SS5]
MASLAGSYFTFTLPYMVRMEIKARHSQAALQVVQLAQLNLRTSQSQPQSSEQGAFLAGKFNLDHPEVLVTTMLDIPGYEIVEIYGTVFGITMRSRNMSEDLIGGELKALSKNIETARVNAVDRMVGHAIGLHANAIVAMRFDTSVSGLHGDSIAVTAYGTACKVRRKENAGAATA